MSENEQELLEGLKALAAAGPHQASPRVEQTLRATFRARAERRRRAVWASAAAGLFAVAAAITLLFFGRALVYRTERAPQTASEVPSPVTNAPDVQYAVVRTDDPASGFYPVPEADELPQLETSLVVQVELPVSSLQLMGFPMDQDAGTEPVQAEVLLGQDGLARGVRLIQ